MFWKMEILMVSKDFQIDVLFYALSICFFIGPLMVLGVYC